MVAEISWLRRSAIRLTANADITNASDVNSKAIHAKRGSAGAYDVLAILADSVARGVSNASAM